MHASMVGVLDRLVTLHDSGDRARAAKLVNELSECAEAGLGSSQSRKGHRIGLDLANEMLRSLATYRHARDGAIGHIEVAQLLVDGISRDRISDFACSILKSFLVDYTIAQAKKCGIPTVRTKIEVLDHRDLAFKSEELDLPVSPESKSAVLLIPKRWLRYSPWIGYDAYFEGGFVKDGSVQGRADVLLYNRKNYDAVVEFIRAREANAKLCTNDPIFRPISVHTAKGHIKRLRKLPSGLKTAREYEELAGALLASTLFPHLDFAAEQSRTDSNVSIRDVIFYNGRSFDFLVDIHNLYDSRQLVFELKNVAKLERDHVNQLNRYLNEEFGRFGILVTRHAPPRAIEKNLVDLWSGQRRCLIVLTDEDLDLMVTLFESRQRQPIEVVKRSYVNFTRQLPT